MIEHHELCTEEELTAFGKFAAQLDDLLGRCVRRDDMRLKPSQVGASSDGSDIQRWQGRSQGCGPHSHSLADAEILQRSDMRAGGRSVWIAPDVIDAVDTIHAAARRRAIGAGS